MSAPPDDAIRICGACGKEGEGLKKCTSCEEVWYCNSACQRAAWKGHKKACKQRAAELRDEALFEEREPEECPICCIPLPLGEEHRVYRGCCGKTVCMGCTFGISVESRKNGGSFFTNCPFCRTPRASTDEEEVGRLMKRVESNDADAIYFLGNVYEDGGLGLPKDPKRAFELWLKAGELGCAQASYSVGNAYAQGSVLGMGEKTENVVAIDQQKAKHHWEIAAKAGNLYARNNLGCLDVKEGDANGDDSLRARGVRHFAMSARGGCEEALMPLRQGYSWGYITKDEYERTLRAYQKSRSDTKSDSREKCERFMELKLRGDTHPEEKEEIKEQIRTFAASL